MSERSFQHGRTRSHQRFRPALKDPISSPSRTRDPKTPHPRRRQNLLLQQFPVPKNDEPGSDRCRSANVTSNWAEARSDATPSRSGPEGPTRSGSGPALPFPKPAPKSRHSRDNGPPEGGLRTVRTGHSDDAPTGLSLGTRKSRPLSRPPKPRFPLDPKVRRWRCSGCTRFRKTVRKPSHERQAGEARHPKATRSSASDLFTDSGPSISGRTPRSSAQRIKGRRTRQNQPRRTSSAPEASLSFHSPGCSEATIPKNNRQQRTV